MNVPDDKLDADLPEDNAPSGQNGDELSDAADESLDLDELSPRKIDLDGAEGVEQIEQAEEDGLQHIRIQIHRAKPGRRLDKYLSGRLGNLMSRTSIQKFIKEGAVTINSKTVKPSTGIQGGDLIEMIVPEPEKRSIPPEPIPVDVIYEDEDILAVNKQANLIVHPARGKWSGTLLNALAYYFQQHQGNIGDLPVKYESYRPGIVHRLDRDTTGVILLAKSERALWRLGRQFEMRRIHKTYLAVVHGHMELDKDVIDLPIGKHPRFREKYAVDRRTGRAFPATTKQATTGYQVLERLGGADTGKPAFTLVQLHPKTGRTHQLRVHLSYLRHPIVGDSLYGGGPIYRSQLEGRPDVAEGPIITRQALHAMEIEFQHPGTLKPLTLRAPLPPDFVAALTAFRELTG